MAGELCLPVRVVPVPERASDQGLHPRCVPLPQEGVPFAPCGLLPDATGERLPEQVEGVCVDRAGPLGEEVHVGAIRINGVGIEVSLADQKPLTFWGWYWDWGWGYRVAIVLPFVCYRFAIFATTRPPLSSTFASSLPSRRRLCLTVCHDVIARRLILGVVVHPPGSSAVSGRRPQPALDESFRVLLLKPEPCDDCARNDAVCPVSVAPGERHDPERQRVVREAQELRVVVERVIDTHPGHAVRLLA